VSAAPVTQLEGQWQGAIVASPAEFEIDVVVEFTRSSMGALSGRVWFPTHPNGPYDMQELSVKGDQISFFARDEAGVVSAFDCRKMTDGASITGTFRENSQSLPFTLSRTSAPPDIQSSITSLPEDAESLRARFNADAESVRVLLILSPGSFSSKMTLNLFDRYVLQSISSMNLRVYVIWEAPATPRTQSLIRRTSALVADPRISYFWVKTRALTEMFSPMAGPARGELITNLCLLFSRGTKWPGPPPSPSHTWTTPIVNSPTLLTTGHRFNGREVAVGIFSLLASQISGSPGGKEVNQ